MKKIIFLLFSMICLISCQDDNLGYTKQDIINAKYQKEFVKTFGNPDPNHNWGFTDLEIIQYPITTRATVNPNSNEWESTFKLNVPDNVTSAEAEYVKNWFATHQNPSSTAIHWEQFFIQYVDCKQSQMNELQVKCLDGRIDHIYNFNNSTKAMQYVYDAGTEAWSYSSNSATGKYYRQWDLYNIQYLTFTASDGKYYEGWYVGFDYESAKEGIGEDSGEYKQFVFRDGYYNDWIVKVSPGTSQGYPVTVRVMCEDLGNSFDWDFNDVVFDVSFLGKGNNVQAKIVLRAAGGTMPITVGSTEDIYEVHKLLGDGSMTPILSTDAPAIYTVDVPSATNNGKNVANAKLIPIYVNGINVTAIDLSETGSPQRFACPDSVMWSPELTNICETYPNFPAWVKDAEFTDVQNLWKYNPGHSFNK